MLYPTPDTQMKKSWFLATTIVGALYFVIAYGSVLINAALPDEARPIRLAAWILSAFAFGGHIWFEEFRRHGSAATTAFRVSLAVAIGAFLLGLAATIHATMVVSHAPYWQHLIALVAWPALTAIPAFVVALLTGALLRLMVRRRET
jgi:hypothetical protein